jgi:hypothetical protein
MPSSQIYENRLIAFLDILGFSQKLKNTYLGMCNEDQKEILEKKITLSCFKNKI